MTEVHLRRLKAATEPNLCGVSRLPGLIRSYLFLKAVLYVRQPAEEIYVMLSTFEVLHAQKLVEQDS